MPAKSTSKRVAFGLMPMALALSRTLGRVFLPPATFFSPQHSEILKRLENSIIMAMSLMVSPTGSTICAQPWVRRSALPYSPHFSKIMADGRIRSATFAESVG